MYNYNCKQKSLQRIYSEDEEIAGRQLFFGRIINYVKLSSSERDLIHS